MESVNGLSVEKEDRISDLPGNVMDCIFKGMPICDAARTSILSRKWRYIWASYPKLVFDMNFYKEVIIKNKKHKHYARYEFPKAINKALFGHCGPILEFSLYVPNLHCDLSLEIDQWMLFLSKNGIKELKLQNLNPIRYILPSCILMCRSLRDLKLHGCIFKTPHAFGGFPNLVQLKLIQVTFSPGLSATLLINAPVLKMLTIHYCTGFEHQFFHVATTVTYFCLVESGKVDWQKFKSYIQLTTLYIELGTEVKNTKNNINMMKFLMDIPKVRRLWLNGFSLKHLSAGIPPLSRTPTPTQSLTRVRLLHFGVDDVDQLSSAIFLLKSCPNLTHLELDLATSTDIITKPIKEILEPFCLKLSLDKLQTVNIRCIKGYKAELLFVKLLLSRSKYLKRMFIEQSTAVGISNGFKISKDLLQLPRASSSAEIIHVAPLD